MNDELAALQYIKALALFSFKHRDELEAIVHKKLKHVYEHAVANCDFYKGRQHPFPFLTKQEVRDNIDTGMISNRHIGDPCLVADRTSGSAGESVPFVYVDGWKRFARMVFPFMLNSDWKWADKYCVFSTIHCSRDRCSTNNLPSYVNRVKIPTSDYIFTDKEILEHAASVLKDNQGTVVHADPVYLTALAVYLEGKRERVLLKGISSTYEILTPSIKKYLENSFQCRVFDNYGCSEFGPVAYACRAGGMHVFEDAVFVEIVDQGRYADQDVGEIVLTSLDNPAMPLIRYRTGDIGKLLKAPCACRKTAQGLQIDGRKEQCISLRGVLYTERDMAGFMDIPGVLLYQVSAINDVVAVHVLLGQGYRQQKEADQIKRAIEINFKKLGEVSVSVDLVDRLGPESSGKFRICLQPVTAQ